ncbi:MAG TPA: hypothetical protein PKK99_05915 [Bacteroidia bacterium]|nr:hypothetical protein [Bacteroidia bacterium]HNP98568.1 hypothetical protein [Bacteroidia bacterium]
MDKREFLRTIGMAGVASLLPFGKSLANNAKPGTSGGCVLIPSETAGPYPLDLSTNAAMFRTDIRETQAGMIHKVRLRIIGTGNCLPMPNLRVDLWHCNVDGYYSGYTVNGHLGNQNHVGETFCRGIQMTDVNGEVEFTTIFPGWYPGRISHIHFQIFVNSVVQATSQLTYPLTEKNLIYTTVAPYTTWGADPLNFSQDNIFSDGYINQLATLTQNTTTGGWDSFLEVGINGNGVSTGMLQMEPETGGYFKMGQNFPNPYRDETTIPFSLKLPADVTLELWDIHGKKVATILRPGMSAGDQTIKVNIESLGLAAANYVYQLEVKNAQGSFRQCKMMSAAK